MNQMNRLLAIGLTFAISNLMASGLIFGANRLEQQLEQQRPLTAVRTELAKAETLAPLFRTPQSRQFEQQYLPDELEKLRSKLIELADVVKEYSDLLLPDNLELAGKLADARKQFENYTPQQLNSFRATLNPAEMNSRMAQARAALEQYRPALESIRQQRVQQSKLQQFASVFQIESAGLPNREGPDAVCNALVGTGRVTAAMTIAADTIFITAAGVRSGLSRGCNQVLVALGEGGNTSTACIAADAVFFVAQAVREKLRACDDDYTGRTVDAAFSRLEHLHTDLDSSIANDNSNRNTIVSNISNSQTAIIGNDNTNKTLIINNDNANSAAITANDNANKTSIVNNDNTNKSAIVSNDNANLATILNAISASQAAVNANTNAGKDELRDLIRRTQIEANLSEEGGKGFVGLYVMPAADGGLLELVRAIVIDTIAKLGGKKTDQANKELAKGDEEKAQGNFNKAYSQYRKAYRIAVKDD